MTVDRREQHRVDAGIYERHSRQCQLLVGLTCDCTPAYRAFIGVGHNGGTRLSRTFASLEDARSWRASYYGYQGDHRGRARSIRSKRRRKPLRDLRTLHRIIERVCADQEETYGEPIPHLVVLRETARTLLDQAEAESTWLVAS